MKIIHYIVFCYLMLVVVTSCKNQTEVFYPKDLDYVEIPINDHSHKAIYDAVFNVNEETVNGILNTRAGINYCKVDSPIIPDTTKSIKLANGKLFTGIIKNNTEIQWGQIKLKNQPVCFDSTEESLFSNDILGRTILEGSIVQIDHSDYCIKLSTDTTKIQPKGFAIPCKFDSENNIYISLKIGDKNYEAILNTGYSGELALCTKDAQDANLQNAVTLENKDKAQEKKLCYISEISIGNKVFKFCRIESGTYIENHLGVSFLRRFKSITIDYINKRLYFELPKDIHINNSINLNFSSDTIQAVPAIFLNQFFVIFNGYGFNLEPLDHLYEVRSVALTEANKETGSQPHIGDTIIGVNNVLFTDSYNVPPKNNLKYVVSNDQLKNQKLINKVLWRDNKALFHYLKNGKVCSQYFYRRQYVKDTPNLCYSHFKAKHPPTGMGLSFYTDSAMTFSIHIPWKNLIGKEYAIKIDSVNTRNNIFPDLCD